MPEMTAAEAANQALQNTLTRGGATNALGLTSLQGINPAQIAAKKAAEGAAKAGAAKFGLGTLMQGLGPALGFYGVLDALGFFDKSMEATPMTPEERELNDAAAKVDMALGLAEKASTSGIASEGMSPDVYLLDAYEAVNALSDSDLEFFGDSKDSLLASLAASGFANIPTLGGSTKPTLVEMTRLYSPMLRAVQ
jgi:hypothetical protein